MSESVANIIHDGLFVIVDIHPFLHRLPTEPKNVLGPKQRSGGLPCPPLKSNTRDCLRTESALPINPISFGLELEFYTAQDNSLLTYTGLEEAAYLRTKLQTDE